MSALTTRLSLYKPGGGSTGTITPDETADIDKLNDNFDLIDAAVGATICTSGTRPGTPYNGQIIFETDTSRFRTWRSAISTWAAGATTRGQLTNYLVTDLTALDALSDATIGDTLYMTTPGTGIDALTWEAFAGSGTTIDWRVKDTVVAATKANLDTFIAAVVAISGTDAQFKIGNLAFVSGTKMMYRLTSSVGALAIVSPGSQYVVPATVAGTGVTINADGSVQIAAASTIASLNDFMVAGHVYRLQGRVLMSAANVLDLRLRAAGADASGASDYFQEYDIGAIATASALGAAQAFAHLSPYALVEIVFDVILWNAADAQTTLILGSYGGWSTGTTGSVGKIVNRHALATSYPGVSIYCGAGTFSGRVWATDLTPNV